MQPPCKHYENNVLVPCERRCFGCRETCEKYKRYQEELKKIRQQKYVKRLLGEIDRDRFTAKGDNPMKRYMRRLKDDHGNNNV